MLMNAFGFDDFNFLKLILPGMVVRVDICFEPLKHTVFLSASLTPMVHIIQNHL
jgi:hypothetical protein